MMNIMKELPVIPLMSGADRLYGVELNKDFEMDSFKLSVLETVEDTTLRQSFDEPVFYNLLRGKKMMYFDHGAPVEYLPGNTMIVPPRLEMEVSFPDSDIHNPTQCLSLTIDRTKIADALLLLNDRYPRQDGREWQLNLRNYSLVNNDEVTRLIFKLYTLAGRNSQEARIIAELTLTELLVILFQAQDKTAIGFNSLDHSPLSEVLRYIKSHLEDMLTVSDLSNAASISPSALFRLFKREFALSPVDYINKERIRKAKEMMLARPDLHIAEIAYGTGFSTPNYFARVFKQFNGVSPSEFKKART